MREVLLSDGGSAQLRSVRAEDAPRIAAFHRTLSLETIHFRYFSGLAVLPPLILRRFSQPDLAREIVIVAEVGSELIALASAHSKASPDTAEVAFVVADAWQGRGLGTLLLEELAEQARARGITRFLADTLFSNRAMLRVFRDAGFAVERKTDTAVVHVAFPIADTPRAQAARETREHLAEARSMRPLLAPRSILLAGGRAPGFTGRIHDDLHALPPGVDLALFAGDAGELDALVVTCGDRGVHALAIGELRGAPEGDARAGFDRELRVAVRAHGMRLLGPDSLGVLNNAPDVGLRAVGRERLPPRGALAVASESPARGAELLDRLAAEQIGVSTFVSLGRRADVSANDCLAFWLADPDTRAIALDLSSVGNPLKFARLAARVVAAKSIVAVATGDSAQDAALAGAGIALEPTLEALLIHARRLLRVATS